jgi:hypothetical protein
MSERDFQMWQVERQLIALRLSLFLLTSSILFLGYVQVRTTWLGIIISVMGLISCLIGAVNFISIPGRLNELEKKLNIVKKSIFPARYAALLFPPFFGTIWVASIIFTFSFLH